MRPRRRKLPSDQEIVGGITQIADDGFCSAYDLHLRPFRHLDRRTLAKALRRAANRGLILQRQGTDGRRYVAVATEGWRLIQSGEN